MYFCHYDDIVNTLKNLKSVYLLECREFTANKLLVFSTEEARNRDAIIRVNNISVESFRITFTCIPSSIALEKINALSKDNTFDFLHRRLNYKNVTVTFNENSNSQVKFIIAFTHYDQHVFNDKYTLRLTREIPKEQLIKAIESVHGNLIITCNDSISDYRDYLGRMDIYQGEDKDYRLIWKHNKGYWKRRQTRLNKRKRIQSKLSSKSCISITVNGYLSTYSYNHIVHHLKTKFTLKTGIKISEKQHIGYIGYKSPLVVNAFGNKVDDFVKSEPIKSGSRYRGFIELIALIKIMNKMNIPFKNDKIWKDFVLAAKNSTLGEDKFVYNTIKKKFGSKILPKEK